MRNLVMALFVLVLILVAWTLLKILTGNIDS